jgi:hypothetical protein
VFRLAASLRDAASSALQEADWGGTCLVSHDAAGVPLGSQCADSLAVWAAEVPHITGAGRPGPIRLAMRLSLSGWPTVSAEGDIVWPTYDDQEKAASWSYYLACVTGSAAAAWAKRFTGSAVGPRAPIPPSGGMAAWLWSDITVPVTSSTAAVIERLEAA